MSKALSVDLRVRVVAAAEAGTPHREVADRFGVSAASVSRWRALLLSRADVRPGPLGGDRRSGRIEAQSDLIRGILEETPDMTIEEMRQALVERGHAFGFGTIHRFFTRHKLTRKKRRLMRLSKTDLTS